MKFTIIISTYPTKKFVSELATELVQSKIVACVNFLKISSIYSWDGKIENNSEYIAIFKTSLKNKNLLKKKIKDSHPYDVPEIVELSPNSVNKPYLDWLIHSTN